MSDLFKSSKDYDSFNSSDLLDIDPDEIERLVKEHSSKSTFQESDPQHPVSKRADPPMSVSSNRLKGIGESVDPGGGEDGKKSRTEDWLGLKEKNKGRLIEELFPADETEGASYLPSAVSSFRPSSLRSRGAERSDSDKGGRPLTGPGPSDPKPGGLPDWLLGDSAALPRAVGSSQAKTETKDIPVPTVEKAKGKDVSATLPDWLVGGSMKDVQEPSASQRPSSLTLHDLAAKEPNTVIEDVPEIMDSRPDQAQNKDLVALLSSVQKELGSAMTKKYDYFQTYFKALMYEAERMLPLPPLASEVAAVAKPVGYGEIDASAKTPEDPYLINQLNLKDLELKNNRLLLEMESLKSSHEIEIETIKKNHSFELSSSEERISRLKADSEEIEESYKEKIRKLKENESLLMVEYKERLDRVEEARLAEIEKLKELHEASLRQAAVLTIPSAGNFGSGPSLRIPWSDWKWTQPKGEEELSQREASLLEKETQLKLEKSLTEGQREAVERMRLEIDERERQLTRAEGESKARNQLKEGELARKEDQLKDLSSQIKAMREEAVREQGEIARERLELAAERARLEAAYAIQGRSDVSLPPLDVFQARVEVDAALEMAREAKESAESERRKHAELRQAIEQISWEQKEADLRLESREKHLKKMMENAEKIRSEGLAALEESKLLKVELEEKENELTERTKKMDSQEKILSKERMEIIKDKMDLERKKSQIDLFLTDQSIHEDVTLHVPKVYVDPKAVILRLKAEKELESSNVLHFGPSYH